MIRVYNMADCPRCRTLEARLETFGFDFETMYMPSAEGMTELRMAGVFTLSAPVLQIDDRFYEMEDLFDEFALKVGFEKRGDKVLVFGPDGKEL